MVSKQLFSKSAEKWPAKNAYGFQLKISKMRGYYASTVLMVGEPLAFLPTSCTSAPKSLQLSGLVCWGKEIMEIYDWVAIIAIIQFHLFPTLTLHFELTVLLVS